MALFVVDPARCKGDDVCIAECPTRIIEPGPPGSPPHVLPELEEFCRNCGHCVAVCAHGAASLSTMATEHLARVRPDWIFGREQVTHFLRARRSIRSYAKKPVERAILADLIDVARHAPSASNRQPVHWLVICEPSEVRRLAGMVVDWLRAGLPTQPSAARRSNERFIKLWDAGEDVICRGAPHLVIASGPQNLTSSAIDCANALTYMELAAPSFGLGTCWAGYFTWAAREWAPLKDALTLPDGHVVCGAIMVGQPRHRYHRFPMRNDAQITWRE